MNHRLYEDWLFTHLDPDGENLNPQQLKELEVHLQECTSCQQLAASWRQVEVGLRHPVMVDPAPGFAQRWQTLLDVEKARLHRRQSLAMLVFSVVGAGLVFGSLLVLSVPWLDTPKVLFWSWIYRLYTVVAYAGEVQQFLEPVLQTAREAMSFTSWMFLVGIVCELGVLWLVSLRLVTNPRRVA